MRPALASFLFFACCGVLFAASPPRPEMESKQSPLLQELVRMTRAGSSDAEVLAYAQAHRLDLPPQVSAQDLRWLRDSGVSARVVSYMSAYDVRATDEETPQEDSSSSEGRPARSRGVYSYPSNAGRDYGSHSSDEYPDNDLNGYADRSYDYPCADYGSDSCGDYGYSPYHGYGYPDYGYSYPFYAFGYPYSFGYGYSPYRGFRRGHRFHGHHRFDGRGFRGHRGGGPGRFAPRDGWRERGFRGSRGGPRVVGPRGSARSSFGRGSFGRGPRSSYGRPVGPRGFGSPGAPRGGSAGGFRGPERSFGSPGGFSRGFSRPSFSGGPRIGGGSPGARGRR